MRHVVRGPVLPRPGQPWQHSGKVDSELTLLPTMQLPRSAGLISMEAGIVSGDCFVQLGQVLLACQGAVAGWKWFNQE